MFLGTLSALQRHAAMRDLYRAGSATSREIFEVEFGHFPPNGLDYDGKNKLDRKVKLSSHFEDKTQGWLSKALMTVSTAGYVHGKMQIGIKGISGAPKNETIFINQFMMGPIAKGIAAFAGYSIAKSLLSTTSLAGFGGFLMDHAFLSMMTIGSALRFTPLTEIFTFPFRSMTRLVGHEHMHILQVHDAKRANTGFDMDEDRFKNFAIEAREDFTPLQKSLVRADSIFSLGSTNYLLNDVEVQARLHTTIAAGYHRWERIPRTLHEFWAACIDSGMNAPREIREEVQNSTEEGVKEFLRPGLTNAFMRAARPYVTPDTAELNAAQRSLRDSDLEMRHWQVTLPFMYGHMLELYGDTQGRTKMGFLPKKRDPDPFADNNNEPIRLTRSEHHLRAA